jgi:uncharacterized protein YndB with AHSA1/START domain
MENLKVIGQTKDAGFQIGVRKTFPVSVNQAWDFLFDNDGLLIWLDGVKFDDLVLHQAYKTKEGIEGKINTLKPYSHIRLTWKRKNWSNTSAVQVRVLNSKDKATISFHQDKLLDQNQREEMKAYWSKVIEEIDTKLKAVASTP